MWLQKSCCAYDVLFSSFVVLVVVLLFSLIYIFYYKTAHRPLDVLLLLLISYSYTLLKGHRGSGHTYKKRHGSFITVHYLLFGAKYISTLIIQRLEKIVGTVSVGYCTVSRSNHPSQSSHFLSVSSARHYLSYARILMLWMTKAPLSPITSSRN